MSIVLFIILLIVAFIVVYGLNREVRGRKLSHDDPSGPNMVFSTIVILLTNIFASSAATDFKRFLIFAGLLTLLFFVNMDSVGLLARRRNGR